MNESSFSLRDWKRLLVGNAPFSFLLEVFIRTLIVYAVLVVIVRLLGKRMSGQVANLELGVMIVLGAIVSVPFETPERGIVPAVVLLVCVLGLQRTVSSLGARYNRVEEFTQGRPSILLCDGVLVLEELERAGISQGQLFSMLRCKGIRHLGQLKRVYLEACGVFSLLRENEPKPGLSVLPGWDDELQSHLMNIDDHATCEYCGYTSDPSARDRECPHCHHHQWTRAVREPSRESEEESAQHETRPEAASANRGEAAE
jgi:uncharacterized membrane protein YcaP (DUF421 family)